MDGFEPVRAAARELRSRIVAPNETVTSTELVARALKATDLSLQELPPENPTLSGALGLLDRQFGMVLCATGVCTAERAEIIAHEIGHSIVHAGPETATRRGYGQTATGDPVQRVDAYGIKERREAQANVFARELLLPRSLARKLFLEGNRARKIAAMLEIQLETTYQQLADSLLLPEEAMPADKEAVTPVPLDQFQAAAAAHRGGPFLLEAGPGTGKTKTLVGRIIGLLGEDVPPGSILALTFSNKAAAEMVDRIAAAAGPKATEIWTGTFHSFGLDLIRKHHGLFGRSQDPKIVDATEAIRMLEETLPALPVVHHQNLFEPALALRDILRAISRAKDELIGHEEYARLAAAMEDAAGSEEEKIAAAKAGEVALVYRHYQEKLNASDALDYGDLIMLPALKMQDPIFAKALRERFRYVHVDEYQDINRASAILVRGIVEGGDDLWLVGDARQSIYRFRGASATNVARFEEDYPGGQRGRLGINYRSSEANVTQFVHFGSQMKVSAYSLPLELQANRGDAGSEPFCAEGVDDDAEIDALAGQVQSLHAQGLDYRDQAVLARSNGTLARVADELVARGIPVLYLGPLFERPEVRDLVSLLSLLVDDSGTGLVRVAGFAEYSAPLGDVHRIFETAQARQEGVLKLLGRLETVHGISREGLRQLPLLVAHLSGFNAGSSPWFVLMEFLFERSDYIQTLLRGQAPSDAMRRIAVRQLVDVVRSMPLTGSKSPIARALQRIRHMVMLADDRELRRLPLEAAHLDGVQMLTIHASKGLEFEAVHIPAMYAGAMPARNQPDRCPPPNGMLTGFEEPDAHEAEEECLFFVALSRARSHLRLYRPEARGSRKSNASRLLDMTRLPRTKAARLPLVSRTFPRQQIHPLLSPSPPQQLGAADIELYDQCPRRFFYERVLNLRGYRGGSAFLAAHRSLLAVIDYLRGLRPEETFEPDKARAIYEEAWAAHGPVDHVYATEYRKLTEGMLSNFSAALAGSRGSAEKWLLHLAGYSIEVRADQIVQAGGNTVVRSVRSGRQRSTEADRLANTLLLKAIKERWGDAAAAETLYLQTGAVAPVSQTASKFTARVTKCENVLSGVSRGNFPPEPSEFTCPRCAFFFVCPAPLSAAEAEAE